LAIAVGLGLITWRESRQAQLGEIKAIAKQANVLFTSNKKILAMIEAIEATKKLQALRSNVPEVKKLVEESLHQAVEGAIEYNSLSGHAGEIYSISYSPDGQTLASASSDKTVKIWSKDGKLLHTLKGHQGNVLAVAFSPIPPTPLNKGGEGGILASRSADNTIKLWQSNGKLITTIAEHKATVVSVAFSPDGKILASGSADNTIKLWHKNGKLITTIDSHDSEVKGLAFSPDGKTIASVSEDGKTKLWQPVNQDWHHIKLVRTLYGHQDGVDGVAFSPNGQTLASASEDKTIILWNLSQIEKLDFSKYACNWVQDFLHNNPQVSSDRRHLCD
jgi:WD40 repeat protein